MSKSYEVFDAKTCHTVRFNYYPGSTDGEFPQDYQERHVGLNGVVMIVEHISAGEGDKHYFDVVYENDRVERIFNPHQAFYSIDKK